MYSDTHNDIHAFSTKKALGHSRIEFPILSFWNCLILIYIENETQTKCHFFDKNVEKKLLITNNILAITITNWHNSEILSLYFFKIWYFLYIQSISVDNIHLYNIRNSKSRKLLHFEKMVDDYELFFLGTNIHICKKNDMGN